MLGINKAFHLKEIVTAPMIGLTKHPYQNGSFPPNPVLRAVNVTPAEPLFLKEGEERAYISKLPCSFH